MKETKPRAPSPPKAPSVKQTLPAEWPEREEKDDVALTLRLSRELRDVLYGEAKATHRSLNSLITIALETVLEAQNKWPPGSKPKTPAPFWATSTKKDPKL